MVSSSCLILPSGSSFVKRPCGSSRIRSMSRILNYGERSSALKPAPDELRKGMYEKLNLHSREHVIGYTLVTSTSRLTTADSCGTGLPPEKKLRLRDDECEMDLENIIVQKQRADLRSRFPFPWTIYSSGNMTYAAKHDFRCHCGISSTIVTITSDLGSIDKSITSFEDFTVSPSSIKDRELKITVVISGARTQAIFNDVFSKLVAAAQPIPGFRRVKGGKTPDIPKDVLLHILGPSKVNRKTINKMINATVAEYVGKNNLKVTKDLRVEQSYEELESKFQPGKDFGFDGILELQDALISKS